MSQKHTLESDSASENYTEGKDESSSKKQTKSKEDESLFDFTAPKDPRANELDTAPSSPSTPKQPQPQQQQQFQQQQQQQRQPLSPTIAILIEEEESECDSDIDDIDHIVENLLNGSRDPNSVDFYSIPPVIVELHKIRDEHLFDHDIDLAQKADEISIILSNRQKSEMKVHLQQETEESVASRLHSAKADLKSLERRCKRAMNNMKRKHARDVERLTARHNKEMEEFAAKWQKPQVIRKYAAASSRLRHLRNQNVNLMMTRRYDDLRRNDKEVKVLERQEMNESFRQMSIGYDAQLLQLQERQKYEISVLRVANEGREGELKAASEKEIFYAQKRVQALEQTFDDVQDPDKLWNLHCRHQKAPTSRSLTPVKIPRPTVNQFALNTLALPPLGDPRSQSQHGFRRRMQSPVFLC